MRSPFIRAFAVVGLLGTLVVSGCTSGGDAPGEVAPHLTTTNYTEFDALFADWAPKYVECARRFGADARLLDSGSIENAYAPGRSVEEGLDAECLKEVGYPPSPPALTDAYLAGLYELFVVQAQCLREHGYTISDPPSRDQWVENYDGYSWNPLMDVNNVGRDVEEADGLCPQPEPREAERIGSTL